MYLRWYKIFLHCNPINRVLYHYIISFLTNESVVLSAAQHFTAADGQKSLVLSLRLPAAATFCR